MPFDGHTAYDFPVEVRDVFVRGDDGGFINAGPKHQAIVRTDEEAILGIHGSRYKVRPYSEQVNRLMEVVEGLGHEVSVSEKVYGSGEQYRREILFKDLKIEPKVNDIVKFRIDLFNSYDGSWAEQFVCWAFRLWCLNGCTTSDFSVRSVIKHTNSEFNRELAVNRIENAIEMFFQSETEFRRWIGRETSTQEIEHLFIRTIAHAPTKKDKFHFSKPCLDSLMLNYAHEDPTLWGAYNAATSWATHIGEKVRGAPQNVERNRNNAVAKMLRAPEWLDLAA